MATTEASLSGQIRSRVPVEEYRALPGVSITRLKELKRSALHYRYRLEHPAESAPLTLGTAAHCAVLEPERFERQFAVWNRRSEKTGNLCPRNGQFWEAFLLEHAGRTIITEDECALAQAIAHAVRSDPLAGKYFEAGEPEVSMQWSLTSESMTRTPVTIDCHGRADWLTTLDNDEPYLIGLKTARDCRPFIFGSAAARLGYHLQWAFYLDGYRAIRGVTPHLREIVVESAPPHDVVVYQVPEDIILQGRQEYETLLRDLLACERSGEWLGVAHGTEQVLTLPSWIYQAAADDLGDLGLTE